MKLHSIQNKETVSNRNMTLKMKYANYTDLQSNAKHIEIYITDSTGDPFIDMD